MYPSVIPPTQPGSSSAGCLRIPRRLGGLNSLRACDSRQSCFVSRCVHFLMSRLQYRYPANGWHVETSRFYKDLEVIIHDQDTTQESFILRTY